LVPRLIVLRDDRLAVGSIGINPPDDDAVALIGYSVYPSLTGQGFASEAAAGLVEWGLRRPEINAIRATIPVGHTASELVAGRAGLTLTGEQVEDEHEDRTLNVWERRP
jgi:RimJ/RimL family protein N-acetyltransferase